MPETNAHLTSQRFKRRKEQLDEAGLVGEGSGDDVTADDVTVSLLRLGPAEAVTIASGVAVITESFVRLTSETSTSDTLDTITLVGVADGDVVVVHVTAGHTITCSKAGNLAIGAATRAVAPGGSISFVYNGASSWWQELSFLTAADST